MSETVRRPLVVKRIPIDESLIVSACPFVPLRRGNYDHAFSKPGLHAGPGALHCGRIDLGLSLAPGKDSETGKRYKDPKRKIQILIDVEAKLLQTTIMATKC